VRQNGFWEGTMKLPRRQFLRLAAGAAALPALPHIATAQNYPIRPVRLIVGYAAGGGSDILARLIGQWLSERLGRPFIVENRPGANTNIATEAAVRASPDGYTLLVVDRAAALNATLYDKLTFNFVRDIAPVSGIASQPGVMVINPSVEAKTVPEFVAYAKANPGKVNMASGGIGSMPHMSGELFKMMAGVNMVHVPYRGGAPALTDLLGGQMQVGFLGSLSTIEYIRTGRLRALAVTSATRLNTLPDIPSLSEFLPGYEADDWKGIGAPKGTPVEIIAKLNEGINGALADPNMKARLAESGGIPLPGSSADFRNFIAAETEKWGKVIRAANIKAE
jgi:tripartite-type tricarboxylate transporter receptor subunit TctC